MNSLRTPDERFAQLPDYPFAPQYLDIASGDGATLRVHYLDEGPRDASETVLLLHGEPSWSYLYRHMIPGLVAAGFRVVAPDLVGFGKSDKPAARSDYTFAAHVAWLDSTLFGQLDLSGITLFCQDWGGLLGLRMVAAHPERFDRVVVANTGLPTGMGKASDAFLAWQNFSQTSPVFPIGMIVNGGTVRDLSEEEVAA
ncbi:MAG: haloalkane dehalogenase, partial [Actinomycetota bacterium]